ncbi:putative membrane protein YgcG [Catenuloplanes nepalensis]|uniref:Membrane protein YgcG n=1 Tax=Catenuloplanes nepalensis TaxID=587533 RepID=A0ABT9MXM1_9ACTN|nr:hypothetical protein [Catenuloplanes nepalensis]MDP9796180.1 putative membrane protein YgcG [Catenuloplanes nepalensis]
MGNFLSAVVRFLLGLAFAAVGVFVFSQIGWPYLTAYLRAESTVTVAGPCEQGMNESEQVCAASWTLDGAPVRGEVRGHGLAVGDRVAARVDGTSAIVLAEPVTLLLYCVPLLFVLVGLVLAFSRRGRWSSGGGWEGGDGDGGGDGGGGGD